MSSIIVPIQLIEHRASPKNTKKYNNVAEGYEDRDFYKLRIISSFLIKWFRQPTELRYVLTRTVPSNYSTNWKDTRALYIGNPLISMPSIGLKTK